MCVYVCVCMYVCWVDVVSGLVLNSGAYCHCSTYHSLVFLLHAART